MGLLKRAEDFRLKILMGTDGTACSSSHFADTDGGKGLKKEQADHDVKPLDDNQKSCIDDILGGAYTEPSDSGKHSISELKTAKLQLFDIKDIEEPDTGAKAITDGKAKDYRRIAVPVTDVRLHRNEVHSPEFQSAERSVSLTTEVGKSNQKRKSSKVASWTQSSKMINGNVRSKNIGVSGLSKDVPSRKGSLSAEPARKNSTTKALAKSDQDYLNTEKLLPQGSQESTGAAGSLVDFAQVQKCPVVGLKVCYYANCHYWHSDHCNHPESLIKI